MARASRPANLTAAWGRRMVSFEQVEAAASQDREPIASLLAAGSTIIEANGESDANVCSYGEAYRRAARGGAYVVTVADFPQPSLYVSLDMQWLLEPACLVGITRPGLHAMSALTFRGSLPVS